MASIKLGNGFLINSESIFTLRHNCSGKQEKYSWIGSRAIFYHHKACEQCGAEVTTNIRFIHNLWCWHNDPSSDYKKII